MFTTIFSIVFLLLAMVSVIPGILKARTQHWSEALVKAVLTLVAAVLTVILTAALSPKLSYALVGPISSALDGTAIAEIFAEMASSDDAMAILLSLIITPFVFILFFLILKLIFLFVARPLTKLCLSVAGKIAKKDFVKEVYEENPIEKNADKEENATKEHRHFSVRSAICGAICGLLTYTILLIPIVASFEMIAYVGNDIIDTEGTAHEISGAMSDNIGTTIIHPISAPIWKNFTYYTINGEEVSIENEAHFIAVFMEALGEMSSKDPATINHSAEIFKSMSSLCPDTSLVPCLCADFINAASAHWLEGEAFGGIQMPSLTPEKEEDTTNNDIVSTLVKCLENSTQETMKEDLATISNVMAIIAENAILDEKGSINVSAMFNDEAVLSKFSVELLKNPRLSPVMGTLVKQSQSEESKLDLPEKDGEEYNKLVDDLMSTYQSNVNDTIDEDTLENLSEAVGDSLAEKGIELDEREKIAVASTLISEFGTNAELTPEMVAEFIEQYRK